MSWLLVFMSLQNISRTQSNDLSYMEQVNVMFGGSLLYLCVHRQLPYNDTYIQHLESRLCRVDVAPLRAVCAGLM